jgi:hypothetical protein
METQYPQVVLFGSIPGDWREQHVIPALEAMGVTYYNPISPGGWWTPEMGDRETVVMAHCETIVMVFNTLTPAFTALAEAGWAALSAVLRGQHFILQVDPDYTPHFPEAVLQTEGGEDLYRAFKHWGTSSRHLVYGHAKQFTHERIHVVDDLDAVVHKLREIYASAPA